jgi:hypothetical protein
MMRRELHRPVTFLVRQNFTRQNFTRQNFTRQNFTRRILVP